MNLMPLAKLLEAAALGVTGASLFVEIMPTEVVQGILLRNPPPGSHINHEVPNFYRTEFQLTVRAPAASYAAGEMLAAKVTTALTMTETQVDNLLFRYCRPRNDAVVTALADGSLVEFSVPFDCCFIQG